MPNPFDFLEYFEYLKEATWAAGLTSALIATGFHLAMRKHGRMSPGVCVVVGLAAGLFAGFYWLQFSWTISPANALGRFLTYVLPASLFIEFVATTATGKNEVLRVSQSARETTEDIRHDHHFGAGFYFTAARFILFVLVGRILLHGSVYLNSPGGSSADTWSNGQQFTILSGAAVALLLAWYALTELSRRAAAVHVLMSLSMALFVAGGTTMMAGYIQGGAAALPLAGSLFGITCVAPLLARPGSPICNGAIGVGLMSLFSLVWIGRFFGQLPSEYAVAIFFAPLLCWMSELPVCRKWSRTHRLFLGLVVVAIPLGIILWDAKKGFDQKKQLLFGELQTQEGLLQQKARAARTIHKMISRQRCYSSFSVNCSIKTPFSSPIQ